jgi:hypothetical protein
VKYLHIICNRYSVKKKAKQLQNKKKQAADSMPALYLTNLKNVWKPLVQVERAKGKQQHIMKCVEVQLKVN